MLHKVFKVSKSQLAHSSWHFTLVSVACSATMEYCQPSPHSPTLGQDASPRFSQKFEVRVECCVAGSTEHFQNLPTEKTERQTS